MFTLKSNYQFVHFIIIFIITVIIIHPIIGVWSPGRDGDDDGDDYDDGDDDDGAGDDDDADDEDDIGE